MSTTAKTPVLFVSHGAPTFAIEPGLLGPELNALGERLHDIKAVLVVSPHWQTRDVTVMTTQSPETVHDFGGFPSDLYSLQYPVAGHAELAKETIRLLNGAGFKAGSDDRRGLDHGAWVPLMHLFPQAKVPVFQVSMPFNLDTQKALKLGQALAPLRDQGLLILASGAMTHNLYDYRQAGARPAAYAEEFAAWVQQRVLARETTQLMDYRTLAPHAERAHPSEEHFLPLLVATGAASESDEVSELHGGICNGAISMDSYAWEPAQSRPS
jgi:4,5-DOPA dioxygenase extradiol